MFKCQSGIYEWVADPSNKLGYGNFGTVYPGRDTSTNAPIAVKVVDKDMVLQEDALLRSLSHPNIVRLYASTVRSFSPDRIIFSCLFI